MKTQKCSSLLRSEDLVNIFSCGRLFEQNSFHYIDKETGTYDINRDKSNFILESKLLYDKYQQGHTIIVKNLEDFNDKIKKRCNELGSNTNVHMYLVPPNGNDSFSFHTDERNVTVEMIYGEKTFHLKDCNDNESIHPLTVGETLFIKKGQRHKAVPTTASCLLSFGYEETTDYKVPTLFKTSDFL